MSTGILLIAVGVVALGQQAYYTRKIALINQNHERTLANARSAGRADVLQDPDLLKIMGKQIFDQMTKHSIN